MLVNNSTPKYNPVYFSGYTRSTKVSKEITSLGRCISESHLMRNLDATIFARDYLEQHFKNGGKILVPGCSLCEGYTWATLMDKFNSSKKFNIIATDIIPEVIDKAKRGVLPVGRFIAGSVDEHENFLINTYFFEALSKNRKEAKTLFNKCFVEEVPSEEQPTNWLKSLSKKKVNKHFIPKDNVFDNVLSFRVENVNDIDISNSKESAIAISFRNALYHILGAIDKCQFFDADIEAATKLFEKFHSVLKKDGLLLLGSLPTEHLLVYPTRNTKILAYGDDLITISPTRIHEILEKVGFKPLFYEDCGLDIHLPTVWQKAR